LRSFLVETFAAFNFFTNYTFLEVNECLQNLSLIGLKIEFHFLLFTIKFNGCEQTQKVDICLGTFVDETLTSRNANNKTNHM
jgi:hypothetical protein